MSDHDWFAEHLDLYGAGALAAEECLRLERHAAQCAKCAQGLAQRRLLDQGLDRLCSPVHFAADWDQRVQAKWQVTHKPPRRLPALVRWTAAAAAVFMVAALGAAVNSVVQMGFLAFPGGEMVQADYSLPNVLPVFKMDEDGVTLPSGAYLRNPSALYTNGEKHGKDASRAQSQNNLKEITLNLHVPHEELADLSSWRDATHGVKLDDGIQRSEKLLAGKFAPSGNVNGSAAAGLTPSGTLTPNLNVPVKSSSDDFSPPTGHYGNALAGEQKSQEGWERVPVPDGGNVALGGIMQRLDVLQEAKGGDVKFGFTAGIQLNDGSVRTPEVAFDNGRSLDDAKKLIADVKESQMRGLMGFGVNAKTPPAMTPPPSNMPAGEKARQKEEVALSASIKEQQSQKAGTKDAGLLKHATEYYSMLGSKQSIVSSLPAGGSAIRGFVDNDGSVTGLKPPTFVGSVAEALGKQQEKAPAKAADAPKSEAAFLKALGNDQGPQVGLQNPVIFQQPKPDPQVAQRKIIRTGEMEFEVESFDNTVAQVTKLINAIPGAFVATVNSDKLPNGKMKGAVVVRVPPEHLDKFVADLKQTLAKTSELKSQRIGSADVTKQYTDIESRLRAARTMEERFIAIIKNGKGEVKDLIAAERELGIWRTKIEEMEGEIRFYNNQVGLSTLTINAFEKEIRAAASMVITEQVTMKIEADDVEKSLQAALAAVAEAKGRVTKSDLKQHAAGQLEAILQFEVAPAAAGAVKDKLKKLGIVTHHDAQRLQQAEGGPAPALDSIKSRTNDVQFNVTMYNVANIKPRQEFILQVAVQEVAPEYHRLLDLVLQASGQVRVSQLNESDKNNIFAQLDFDVPSTKRELFDLQLPGLGDVVSKSTTRAGPGETATDRKVGYRLTLKSVISINPREAFVVQAFSQDVPGAYKKLQDAVAKAKGHVRVGQVNEQDKNNINAQLDFDVAKGEEGAMDKLLDEIGEVFSRTTNRIQPGEVATDRKVGYRLTLRSQVPPRETLDLVIEPTRNVDRTAADFAAAVVAAKGKVLGSKVTQDSSGRSVATQVFIVPLAEMGALVQKFKEAGPVRGQDATKNTQAPDGKLAVAQIAVRLTNANPIIASDEGLWPQVRTSLTYAFRLLSVSLMFVIVGISVILPWALLIWVGAKIVRRIRAKGQAAA